MMRRIRKAVLIYLCVSSVILHGIAAFAFYRYGPLLSSIYKASREFINEREQPGDRFGIVQDISVFRQGDNAYTGCSVEYNGQTLYVAVSGEELAKGDRVRLITVKAPYPGSRQIVVVAVKERP